MENFQEMETSLTSRRRPRAAAIREMVFKLGGEMEPLSRAEILD
jgi:hypothetical protein